MSKHCDWKSIFIFLPS